MSEGDHRLRVLRSTHLLDSPPERAFDRLTRLAAGLIGAPVAIVSLVDEHRQFFKSAVGLKEPWASRRETPLTHSFCKLVVQDVEPLIVDDARQHPVLCSNQAIRDLDVIAYAGIPLLVAEEPIGAFCVVDDKPRQWSKEEVRLLEDLAESVVSEIDLRIALRSKEEQRSLLDALIESLGDGVLALNAERTFLIANRAARRVFAQGAEAGQPLPADWARLHRSLRIDGTPLPSEEGALVRALRGEDTDGLTFTLHGPDAGEAVWVEATGRPVRASSGEVIAGVAVYRDVTERMRRVDVEATLARTIPRAAVAMFDRNQRCLAIDGGLLEGTPRQSIVGRTMRELSGLPPGDPRFEPVDTLFQNALDGHEGSIDYLHEDGRVYELRTAPVRDAMGRVTAGVVLTLDRTEERRLSNEVRRSEQVHRAIVKHLPNGAVFMVDRDLRYVSADGPMVDEVLRKARWKTLVGRTVQDVVSDENRDEVLAIYRGAFEDGAETRHYEIRRGSRFFEVNVVPIFDGNGAVTHAVAFLYDVTTRKMDAIEQERRLAVDMLTGVASRRAAERALAHEDERRKRAGTTFSVALFDVDHFKKINDTFGHATGDAVLRLVASTLAAQARTNDLVARWGGEEFLAVLAGPLDGAVAFSERARKAIEDLVFPPVGHVTISVGVAEVAPTETPADAIARADERLYEAKRGGRNRVGS